MKNKEKYAKEIIEIACSGDSIAVIKKSGHIVSCNGVECNLCLFDDGDCRKKTREWAESEYIEKPVISKRAKAFLEYLREEYKFVARDEDGKLFVYSSKPYQDKNFKLWLNGCCNGSSLRLNYNVEFPMVKWEDDEPWLIEDLKKLEVVDEYGKE